MEFPSDSYKQEENVLSDTSSTTDSDTDTLDRVLHIDIAKQQYKPVQACLFMFTNPAKAQGLLDEKLNKNRLEEYDIYSNVSNDSDKYTKNHKKHKRKMKKKHRHDSVNSDSSSSSSWTSAGTSSGTSSDSN